MNANLTAIASQHLGLETLETRNSDGLDFSDQSVWAIKAALEAAYAAGQAAASRRSARGQQAATQLRAIVRRAGGAK